MDGRHNHAADRYICCGGTQMSDYVGMRLVEQAKRIAELEAKNNEFIKANIEVAAINADLLAQLAELREERKAISEYCWSKAGGSQSVAGDIYRYLNQDEPLLPEEGK